MAQLFHYQQNQNVTANVPTMQAPPAIEGSGSRILRAALGSGAEALKIVARDYNRYQTCRVSDAVQDYDRRMAEWQAEYTKTNQGKDATQAQRDFTEAAERFSKETLDEFGGSEHEVFRHDLEKQLLSRGLMAFRDGGKYQEQQTQLWERSVWDGQLAGFQRDCSTYYNDPDRLELKRNELLQSWQQMNPGLDPTGIDLRLRETQAQAVLDSMLLRGEQGDNSALQGAKNMLNHGGTATGASQGGPRVGSGTIAEDLHNPLNLKRVGANGRDRGAYENFASDADGFRGAANQLRIYQTKYGLKTPRQMVQRWAPASDGNNHKTYFQNMAAAGLTDIDAPIDVNNPRQMAMLTKAMAMLTKAMATAEGPLGKKYNVEQITRFLQENGGKADKLAPWGSSGTTQPVSGVAHALPPDKRMAYLGKIEAMRKRNQLELRAGMQNTLENWQAQCMAGIATDLPFDFQQVHAAFGEQAGEVWKGIQDAHEFATSVNSWRDLPDAELEKRVLAMQPKAGPDFKRNQERYKHLYDFARKMKDQRAKDPAAWLIANDAKTGQAYQNLIANFPQSFTAENFSNYLTTLGAGKAQREMKGANILPVDTAKALATQLESSPDPATAIAIIKSATGASFPQIGREIMPKASVEFNILANNMPKHAVKAVMDARKNKDFDKDVEKLMFKTGTDKSDFDAKVFEAVQPFNSTLSAGGNSDMAIGMYNTVRSLALAYAISGGYGKNLDEAIARALDDAALRNYDLVENINSAHQYRIPKSVGDTWSIQAGASGFLKLGDLSGLSIAYAQDMPEDRQKAVIQRRIRYEGYWVTNGDESGLELHVAMGMPVFDKNGNRFSIKWKDLPQYVEKPEDDFVPLTGDIPGDVQ